MNARLMLLVTAALSITLSACETAGSARDLNKVEMQIAKNGQYWQRSDATSAVWQTGPKAQQLLNRDIAACVTTLGELERLGQIKSAFPAEKKDTVTTADAAQKELMGNDTPERDGNLLMEPTQYNDFEACMRTKGWERVLYVPHDVAQRGAEGYMDNHIALQSRTTHEKRGTMGEKTGPYDNLNN